MIKIRNCNICNSTSNNSIFEKYGFKLVRCRKCGLVFVRNPPSKRELKKLYSFNSEYHKVFLNEISEEFLYHSMLAKKHYKIMNQYGEKGRVLDVGCSVGLFLKEAQKDGWKSYGLELSKDSAKIAKEKYGLNVQTKTIEQNKFGPNYFDVVTMWEVIEHVEDPKKTLTIINKLLKTNGIVILSTPNIEGIYPRISYFFSKLIKYWPHPEPPHHLFQFSKKTITNLLEKTGFSVLKIIDNKQPLASTRNELIKLLKSPKKVIYYSFFSLFSLMGPFFKSGDNIIVISKKTK